MLRVCLPAIALVLLACQATFAQQILEPEPAYYEYESDVASTAGCNECESCECESGACGACNGDCGGDCGKMGILQKHKCKKSGQDYQWLWDSCECNGSYKFPVPPLYTYHWPGLYAHRLMTDYHSPWRFPAIRPYEDEAPGDELSSSPSDIRQVSRSVQHSTPVRTTRVDWPSGVEPVSEKIKRFYR